MEKRLVRLVVVMLALAAISAGQGGRTFTGVITDTECSTGDHSHMRMGPTDAECVAACVSEHGAAYLLVDGKKEYALSDQKTPEKFAARKVTISGTLDTKGKTIQVDSIRAADSPNAQRVLMDEMTMTEVRAAIASGKTIVLLFNGSTEQTGPHVVLGKHNFKARYLGERMARELGNALVAPVMPFAPTGGELLKFPGTIDLSPETFSKVNEEVTASLVKAGFKCVILLGDHGGNQEPLKTLAPRLDERYRAQGVRVFFSGDSYAKADAEIEAYLKAHGFPPSNHGGVADTSELWAVSAAYVRVDKIAMGDPVNRDARGAAVIGPTGVEGDPRRSSPALGKIFDDIKVKAGVDEIRRLIAAASAR
jgi:creatinine amidohydrolase/Fe(II)-dependent formamide hydrolase-like protein